MSKIKPIEKLAEDVKEGDLVRISLEKPKSYFKGSKCEIVGYCVSTSPLSFAGIKGFLGDATYRVCGETIYSDKVGSAINNVGTEIKEYEILRRAKNNKTRKRAYDILERLETKPAFVSGRESSE